MGAFYGFIYAMNTKWLSIWNFWLHD